MFAIIILIAVWLLNFGISWLNARTCGVVWAETKAIGGWHRFLTWMGAVMSASGFTWCYLIVLLLGTYYIQPALLKEGQEPWLDKDAVLAGFQLGYLIIIPGVLFSGLMIWIDSLMEAWRRRDWKSVGVAGWNTFAQVHNTYRAMKDVPAAWKGVSSFFSGKGDSKGKGALLIILLVVVALIGGVLTTWTIINRYAGTKSIAE